MTGPVRCPILVERDEELRSLSRLASEASALGGRVAVLTGEAGAGKSRLAHEFCASLPAQWSLRTIRCTRSGAALTEVPAQRPLALVLDDAHFLDPAAVGAIARRLDELGPEPVLWLLTFRLGHHRAGSAEMRALADLLRDPRALELRVMPLSPDGIAEMAAAMDRYADEALYERTGGNPFWAEELLCGEDALPWTVIEAVLVRLDALPEAARELACALAVAGEPVSTVAAGELVDELDRAWGALVEGGLAETGPDGIGLRHALVGEAIETRLGPAGLERWHARLAAVLEREGAEPDRVARHWAAAAQPARAAALARPAASELRAAGATRRAYACFALAVREPPAAPLAAAELYEEGALTAARIGEYDTMRDWLELADRRYREADQADRAVRMRLDPSFDYLLVARSEHILDEPVERLLADARAAVRDGDAATARGTIDAAVGAARWRRDGMGLARAARMLLVCTGEFDRAEELLSTAAEYPDVVGHPGRQSRLLTIRAGSRVAQGRVQEGLDLLYRAVAVSRRETEAVFRVGEIALGNALMLAGRVDEGASLLIEAGAAVPGAHWIRVVADGARRHMGGDPSGLDAIADGTDGLLAALDLDPVAQIVIAAHLLGSRALAEVQGGRPSDALRTVARLDAAAPEPFHEGAGDAAYVLARAGAALGDSSALAQARARSAELSRLAGGPGVIGLAEAVRGFAASHEGRGDEAARHFASAAEQYERAPRAVMAAEAWCDAAAAGPGPLAAAALERAQRLCDSNGLERVARRIADVRRTVQARPARTPGELLDLTPREREVTLLAAEGLTNREIGARLYLSEGTVRNYLSTAFGKLGVARRAELARLLAVAGPAGEQRHANT